MAYGVKYRAEYKNKNGDTITINILKNGWTGAVTAIDKIGNPAQLRYKPQENEVVVGSELSFSFLTKDKLPFQELLTAEFKDFKCEMQLNFVKQWEGWLIVDNITTRYFDFVYSFNLSFNDGLAELDRYTITNDTGAAISGVNSLLWYIKNSVKFNGIPLDFAIVLNTKEVNTMTLATDNALAKCSLMADRWVNVNAGKKEVDSAKEVITQILKPFNCKMFQSGGKYWIVNQMEVGSTIYYHNFADLVQSSTATDSTGIDISTKKFERTNELSKKRPLKTAAVIYQNKYIPSNLVTINPNFDTTDVTFWNRTTSKTGLMDVADNELRISCNDTTTASDASGTIITTDPIAIERKQTDDVITIQFDYYLRTITFTSSSNEAAPFLEVTLIYKEDVTKNQVKTVTLGTGKATFKLDFKNVGTGNYVLQLIDKPNSTATYSLIEYRIDNVSAFATTSDGASSIVTYDRFFSSTNTGSAAIDTSQDNVIKVGDGLQINDIGNLRVGSTLTKDWNTAGKTEGLSLQNIYLLNTLRFNQKFKNRVRLSLIANDFQKITFNQKIIFDSITYVIKDFAAVYGSLFNKYEIELIELPTADITVSSELVPLRSVNGESPESELNISEVDPTVPDHVKNITSANITKWNKDYLLATGKAVDSDKLDGLDSTQFLRNDLADQFVKAHLKVQGTNAGALNIATVQLYEADKATRKGFVGEGSSGNSNIYLGADAGNVLIWEQGGAVQGRAWHDGKNNISSVSGGGHIGRLRSISLNWTGTTYDTSPFHGIESADALGAFADSLAINSYNDVTVRLDSNNDNAVSYFRVTDNAFNSSSSIFYVKTGGNCYAGDFIMTSDERLKENFKPITNALEKVGKIETFFHTWKDRPEDGEHLGVSAQQLEGIVPQVVDYDEEQDKYSVSYAKLVPLLIEANKELQKRVEELERRFK
jgi:hypothetical protein